MGKLLSRIEKSDRILTCIRIFADSHELGYVNASILARRIMHELDEIEREEVVRGQEWPNES